MSTSATRGPAQSASVNVNQITVSYGGLDVIKNLDLEVRPGEFLVLLGPSGCGKSTLLNTIAGLQDVRLGRIEIGGADVTEAEPKDRGIAMVFQSYALYPSMDVRGNLSFGLKVAGLPKAEIAERVARAADILELTPLLNRRPGQLSGGQRQRVAIGRALVRDVDVFLFDEPLSNLDAQLRAELRVEIKRLHQRLGNTMIYVTHDQIEALTLADRIAIMKGGVIQQLDHPETVYREPANLFVARFIGSPAMNFMEGRIVTSSEGASLIFGSQSLALNIQAEGESDGAVTVGVRPEALVLDGDAEGRDIVFDAIIELREPLGPEALVWCKAGEYKLCVKVSPDLVVAPGQRVRIGFDLNRTSLFSEKTGNRIGFKHRSV